MASSVPDAKIEPARPILPESSSDRVPSRETLVTTAMSFHQGLRADAVAQPDYDMASVSESQPEDEVQVDQEAYDLGWQALRTAREERVGKEEVMAMTEEPAPPLNVARLLTQPKGIRAGQADYDPTIGGPGLQQYFTDMLLDSDRMARYYEAIAAAVAPARVGQVPLNSVRQESAMRS